MFIVFHRRGISAFQTWRHSTKAQSLPLTDLFTTRRENWSFKTFKHLRCTRSNYYRQWLTLFIDNCGKYFVVKVLRAYEIFEVVWDYVNHFTYCSSNRWKFFQYHGRLVKLNRYSLFENSIKNVSIEKTSVLKRY